VRKQSAKTKRILAYMEKNPDAKASDIAQKYGVHVSRVYQLRKKAEGEMGIKPLPVPEVKETSVDTVLDSRAQDYGAFKDGAQLMQGLKRLMADHAQRHNKTFADDQWEALEMIIHKVGRIVNGNPDKVDHWTDIAGYAKLVADRLEGRVR
jgi:transposase-like protein